MLKALSTYRRELRLLSFILFAFAVTVPMMGCGVPAWLTDASSIIALVGASITSVGSFIAGLTGNAALAAALAVVSTWITKVQTGLADLTALISQYQKSPSASLLGSIESALSDVTSNVQQDFSNLGLPSTVLSVIAGIASLAYNLLAEWSAAISGVKTASTSEDFKAATAKMADLASALPQAMENYRNSVNAILTTKTGDPMVDSALAKASTI